MRTRAEVYFLHLPGPNHDFPLLEQFIFPFCQPNFCRKKEQPNMANRGYDVVVDVDAEVQSPIRDVSGCTLLLMLKLLNIGRPRAY